MRTGDLTDFPFKNNVPDPLLSGKELPTFKFALEKSKGKVMDGSFGKEATVTQLPISKGIAGVSMRLEPGVTRELHWHATAAEWAFVIEGRVRTTTLDPLGRSEINDFDPGDVWYFPRGYPHALSCLGDTPCHFILIFDNGYFSEFGTFSITDWLGHASPKLAGEEFRRAGSDVRGLSARKRPISCAARLPPAETQRRSKERSARRPTRTRYRMLAQEPHSIHKFGREWRVGAEPLSHFADHDRRCPRPRAGRPARAALASQRRRMAIRHRRASSASSLFGSHGRYRVETLGKGDVGYIPQGYGHSIENIGGKAGRILIGLNTGNYQAIDLSQWIASNPAYLLGRSLRQAGGGLRKLSQEARLHLAARWAGNPRNRLRSVCNSYRAAGAA